MSVMATFAARRVAAAGNASASNCSGIAVDVKDGLKSFATVAALIASSPGLLWQCLKRTPLLLSCVFANALSVWIASRPLKWLGGHDLQREDALKVGSLFALLCLRFFLPKLSGASFFAVLGRRDQALREKIEALPVVRGLRAQVLQLLLALVVAIQVLAVTVFAFPFVAPMLGPPLLAALAALAASWMTVVPGTLVLVLVLAGAGWLYSLVAPFVTLWRKLDPVVALVALLAAALGAFRRVPLATIVKTGTVLYLSSSVLTQELLAQYAQRQDSATWNAFIARHRWKVFGFGLPVSALVSSQPVVAVALLEALHGAAGGLLKDLVLADSLKAP